MKVRQLNSQFLTGAWASHNTLNGEPSQGSSLRAFGGLVVAAESHEPLLASWHWLMVKNNILCCVLILTATRFFQSQTPFFESHKKTCFWTH